MKKFLRLICIIAVCACLAGAVGCNNPYSQYDTVFENIDPQYRIYTVDSSDATGGDHYVSEYPLWSWENLKGYQDVNAKPEVTVTFNGKEYTGQYEETYIFVGRTYYTHEYWGDEVWFQIDVETGKLLEFSLLNTLDNVGSYDESTCRNIADTFASQYISLDEYTLEVRKNDEGSYAYTYFRKVSGYRTADSLYVRVHTDGTISSWALVEFGSFQNIQEVTFDEKTALKLVEQKVRETYARRSSELEIEVTDKKLLRLEDDKIALFCTAKYSWTEPLPDQDDIFVKLGGVDMLLVVVD